MTDALLWTLAVLGAWNGINLIGRVIYREISYQYAWSVIVGMWAALCIWSRW